MEEHFSLRWNNFHKNLSSGFLNHLMEDTLVDVTLAADGKFLQAHRLVLSVCSPYFKQLFAIDPCKHPIVILKDVQYKQLSDILTFMYQGEVNVREEDLADFLKTAELLQIRGLTEKNNQSEDTTCVPMQEISNAHLSSAEFDEDNEVQEIDSPTPLEIINKKDIVCSVEKPSPRETIVDDDIESALPQKRLCWDSSPSAMPQSSNTENIKSVFRSVLTKEEPPDTLQESYSHSSTACPQGHFLQDLQNQRSLTLNTDSSIPNGNQPVETSQQISQVNVAGSQEETAHDVGKDNACWFCCRTFSNKTNLRIHIRDIHEGDQGPLSCTSCGRIAKNRSSLRYHNYKFHRSNVQKTTDPNILSSICVGVPIIPNLG